jgi:hypothetical protein
MAQIACWWYIIIRLPLTSRNPNSCSHPSSTTTGTAAAALHPPPHPPTSSRCHWALQPPHQPLLPISPLRSRPFTPQLSSLCSTQPSGSAGVNARRRVVPPAKKKGRRRGPSTCPSLPVPLHAVERGRPPRSVLPPWRRIWEGRGGARSPPLPSAPGVSQVGVFGPSLSPSPFTRCRIRRISFPATPLLHLAWQLLVWALEIYVSGPSVSCRFRVCLSLRSSQPPLAICVVYFSLCVIHICLDRSFGLSGLVLM